MDQHPIPQDVTGFQFKLIGTMTVKQFGYVASGVIMAVILYYLPIPFSAFTVLLKVILVPLFGASGVVIAFVPLEGRPIDVMATNFVKALFSPNQYIYHRQGKRLSFSTVTVIKAPVSNKPHDVNSKHQSNTTTHHDEKGEKLRALLLSSHNQVKSALDKKEAAFLNTLSLPSVQQTQVSPIKQKDESQKTAAPILATNSSSQQTSAAKTLTQPLPNALPSPVPNINNEVTNEDKKDLTSQKPNTAEQEPINQSPSIPGNTQQKAHVLSQQINEIHAQKQQLEQELTNLKTQLATQKTTPTTEVKSPQPVQPLQDPLHVRTIPQEVSKKVGLPHVSDSPNVVVGIVKDPRGNILPNILVEVKDKDGNPVRAFKTNQLGQFVSATPLSPGTYTIELDDPKKQHRFDVIQIVANNQVLLPIEIISHDAREELRKQLFAN